MSKKEYINIEEIGEFGLIEEIKKLFPDKKRQETVVGIGDDAAVLNMNDQFLTLLSTDNLNEEVHFDLFYTPLKHLGFKSVSVSASDICAMNGEPIGVTVGIALDSRFTVPMVKEFYEGVRIACNKYGIDLIGGDTTGSYKGLFINTSIIGKVEKDRVTYRSGAGPGDLICVTGDLGGAYVGLLIMQREKEVHMEAPQATIKLEGYEYLIERLLKPEARLDVVRMLRELDVVPSAMIDISDGLASDLLHICAASNVGCVIYEEKFPIDPIVYRTALLEFNLNPTTVFLSGGEDYELLFTIPERYGDLFENHPDITIIGKILPKEEGTYMISKSGNKYELTAQGWDAFRKYLRENSNP
ncbi:MAG: thiamine-phosphate kinase [Chlorobi bacterium]|nr:thiamine-phosphate kinase [Chlorobiota bacterium]